jgi:hypothetical protein
VAWPQIDGAQRALQQRRHWPSSGVPAPADAEAFANTCAVALTIGAPSSTKCRTPSGPHIAEAEWRGRTVRAGIVAWRAHVWRAMLMVAGASDVPWCVPGQLHGPSLHRPAQLTLKADSLCFRRYRADARFSMGRMTAPKVRTVLRFGAL